MPAFLGIRKATIVRAALLVGAVLSLAACDDYYGDPYGDSTPTDRSGGRPVSTTGTLSIASEGADIYVGGAYLGRGAVNTTLVAGTYTVLAKRPSNGRICWQRSIAVTSGRGSRISDNTYCR